MSARRISVSARLTTEEAAFIRRLGAASDADALRLLIAEAQAGASIEQSISDAIAPLVERLDVLEARQSERIEQATQRALNAIVDALTGEQ